MTNNVILYKPETSRQKIKGNPPQIFNIEDYKYLEVEDEKIHNACTIFLFGTLHIYYHHIQSVKNSTLDAINLVKSFLNQAENIDLTHQDVLKLRSEYFRVSLIGDTASLLKCLKILKDYYHKLLINTNTEALFIVLRILNNLQYSILKSYNEA